MSDEQDKRRRHLELLRRSRATLSESELPERPDPDRPDRRRAGRTQADPTNDDASDDRRSTDGTAPAEETIMYRGRPVRRPAPSGRRRTQGADFRGTAARGRGRSAAPSRRAVDGDEVRQALQRLNELYEDGLISRSDLENKRQEILDRL